MRPKSFGFEGPEVQKAETVSKFERPGAPEAEAVIGLEGPGAPKVDTFSKFERPCRANYVAGKGFVLQ